MSQRRPPKVPRPTPVPRVPSPNPLPERTTVDGDTFTFVWRDTDGEAEAVLLFANRLTDETSLADTLLERLDGTDLWQASFRMGADWRASYSFLVQRRGEPAPWMADGDQVAIRTALDHGRPDPSNPLNCRNRAGVLQSVVEGRDAAEQRWLAPRDGVERGRITRLAGPDGRTVWLYDPPATDDRDELPLLVVLDGEVWVGGPDGAQSLPTTLDNLLADGLGPVRAVFVDSGGREARWADLSSDGSGASYVADDLLPLIRTLRGVSPGPSAITVVGQSLGGLTALRLGLTRPDAVGGVVSHSASLWQDGLLDLTPPPGLRVFLSNGSQEWVLDRPHRALTDHLRAAGVDVEVSIHNGGHDYAWWRGGVAEGIVWLAESTDGWSRSS
ncbi:enterochelin esterase domain-containing protein [Nocardioides sp. Kera G14]|uniref:enterochelin esterase domain-containing protein n=1 Tax=Nocardioides sp. Kera G14 TaxID=2884264 RepID=UPI001D11DBB4|nr:enterochelin esterase domain-containing protein [Nocardioides sp. Kera G14]UDY24277.1 DUF3327 domain-containing protein [Nocardioides sp. Kera G14]